MAVGFKVGFYWFQIGNGDFLHGFFSTIAGNLENGRWGADFPIIMNELYNGSLEVEHINDAIKELKIIKEKLKDFSPDKVIWDIDDLTVSPPWGKNISKEITDLSNYFVTSDGDDFIALFMHALEKAEELQICIKIESLQNMKDGTLGLRRRKGMAVKLEQLKVDKDGNIHSVDSEIKKNKKTADKIINQQPRRERRGMLFS